jgi:citrate synthase
MIDKKTKVRKRELQFSLRTPTKICQETPSKQNPYLAEHCRCHGYELIELARKRSFVDVLYLLFQGELPTAEASNLLEKLMIMCINPGPRHPATRAAMNAGVSRTQSAHILPISLSILGGEHLGGEEVMTAMRFLQQHLSTNPEETAATMLDSAEEAEGEFHIAPGFGRRFGGIDPYAKRVAKMVLESQGAGPNLAWGHAFTNHIEENNLGWLIPGVIAATLKDLNFDWKAGAGLMQIFAAPGLLAHGCEMASQPITAMPFLDEEHYIIADEARKK